MMEELYGGRTLAIYGDPRQSLRRQIDSPEERVKILTNTKRLSSNKVSNAISV
jgi:hypothetical protein